MDGGGSGPTFVVYNWSTAGVWYSQDGTAGTFEPAEDAKGFGLLQPVLMSARWYNCGANMYAYCGGNPITHADPSGMDDEGPGGDAAYTSDFHPDIGGLYAAMDFLDAGLQCVPFYNSATAITGRDVWGRCLKTSDRVSRGIMGALSDVPILGSAANEVGCWLKGGCFTAGTPVVLADGTTKPVETVVQGDEVLSKDEKTGRMEARRVVQVTRRTVGRVVRVTLTDPVTKQSQTLTATDDHPFYVQGKGFVPAGQLGVGTSIVTRAGPALTVSGSALLPQQVGGYAVYNLTVEGDHTYFVGSVDGGAWVHNTCPKVRAHFNNVVKPAFWKNEAKINPANWGQAELELMRAGKPPTGPDGFSYELHHTVPLDDGGTNAFSNLRIMSRTDHRLGPNYKLNHP